jgi:hypothetical protein
VTSRRRRYLGIGSIAAAYLIAAAAIAPVVWPVLPESTMVAQGLWQQSYYKDEIGWQEMTALTARAWNTLPAGERAQTALLARNYGEAGALARYGPGYGLPTPLSGHLSFQYWHPAHMPQTSALLVGFPPDEIAGLCNRARILELIDNPVHIANEEQGRTIVSCQLRAPLGDLWASHIATDKL